MFGFMGCVFVNTVSRGAINARAFAEAERIRIFCSDNDITTIRVFCGGNDITTIYIDKWKLRV